MSVNWSPVFKLFFNFGFTAHEGSLSHTEPGQIARSGVRPPGRGFDPQVRQHSFLQNFYGHSLPTADSNSVVVSYW